MNKFRILSDGYFFKIQRKRFLIWFTIGRQQGGFDDKNFYFGSYNQAIDYINDRYGRLSYELDFVPTSKDDIALTNLAKDIFSLRKRIMQLEISNIETNKPKKRAK